MLSLKSYLSRDTEAEAAYRRVIGLFLQGIALHSVEGNQADHDRFREEIDHCIASLSSDTPMSELLVVVGRALRAMEDYNQRTTKFVRQQNTELQHMVSMLTQTLISVGTSSEHSASKLQEIEKSIERTQAVEDIQLLKLRLGECLAAVREESIRQKQEGQSALVTLQKELLCAQDRMGSFQMQADLDVATGLPSRAEAEKAIREAMGAPKDRYLLIAVCSRVQAVNARFGYAIGDKILAEFATHFKSGLSARDRIFRWHGPAIVALLERSERMERVRAEMRQFADAKLEKTTELGHRSVLIPISAAWSVFQLTPPINVFLKQVEAFTAAQIPRDYA